MSEVSTLKLIGRALTWCGACITAYWCGLWTFQPSWQPDWKRFGIPTLVSLMYGYGGHLFGWSKGYEFAESKSRKET